MVVALLCYNSERLGLDHWVGGGESAHFAQIEEFSARNRDDIVIPFSHLVLMLTRPHLKKKNKTEERGKSMKKRLRSRLIKLSS